MKIPFQSNLVLLLAMAFPVCAQSAFDGTWQIQGTGFPFPWSLYISTEGTVVGGMVRSCSSNGPVELFDAAIEGGEIRFKCMSGGEARLISFRGVRDGDQITFDWTLEVLSGVRDPFPDGMFDSHSPARFTLKRVPDGGLKRVWEDRSTGSLFSAAVNLVPMNFSAKGTLFIPDRVNRIRYVLVVIDYGHGEDVFYMDAWRRLARDTGAALFSFGYTNIARGAGVSAKDAAVRTTTLNSLLQSLARDSGHQELVDSPLLFWGYSIAAANAATFANQFPDRTLAFIRYHAGPDGVIPNEGDAELRVPALLISGAKEEGVNNVPFSEARLKRGRSLRAPWTFAVEPDVAHFDVVALERANALMVPWVTAVVNQRLPVNGSSLRSVTDNSAWLGNNSTGDVAIFATFAGEKADASWLPDETRARAWQKILGKSK